MHGETSGGRKRKRGKTTTMTWVGDLIMGEMNARPGNNDQTSSYVGMGGMKGTVSPLLKGKV